MAKDKETGASRQERKAKKRKLEDAIPDVPEDDAISTDVQDAEICPKKRKTKDTPTHGILKEEKPKKNSKKDDKKETKAKADVENTLSDAPAMNDDMDADQNVPRKSKKERKAERRASEAARRAAGEGVLSLAVTEAPASEVTTVKTAEENVEKAKKNNRNREKKREAARKAIEDGAEPKSSRFIVFVGNLPFSANKASIEKHFASVKPKSVRALTQKDDPMKSKGCAFVEFEGYDHMKTCLKLFHHSEFDDGISPARQINVELSAGGGGNTKARKGKIVEKNQKLNEERVRRRMEEAKAKLTNKENGPAVDQSAVHPSRRARIPEAA